MSRRIPLDKVEYIIKNYPYQYAKDIAQHLSISESCVYNVAFTRGIKKDPAFREMELQRQADRLKSSGQAHRFSKDHEPFNKGKKMPAELYDKVKKTMFKKGTIPPNFKPDGSERVDKDGYTYIKTNGKFIKKHTYIYELHHGAMPEGYIVYFKDGNRNNLTIENLGIQTRVDNMLKNTIHNYPSDLVGVIKILKNLKKKINAKKQN